MPHLATKRKTGKKKTLFFSVAIPVPPHISTCRHQNEKKLKKITFFVFRGDTGTATYRHTSPPKGKKLKKNHFFVFRGDTGTATYRHTSPPKGKKLKKATFLFSVAIPVPPHIATHRHQKEKS